MIDTSITSPRTSRNRLIIWLLLLTGGVFFIIVRIGSIATAERDGIRPLVARANIENFAIALEKFKVDIGRYPTDSEGLQALLTRPNATKEWNGPYRKSPTLKDPWDHPYNYRTRGERYKLLSYGRDGTPGGMGEDADISPRKRSSAAH